MEEKLGGTPNPLNPELNSFSDPVESSDTYPVADEHENNFDTNQNDHRSGLNSFDFESAKLATHDTTAIEPPRPTAPPTRPSHTMRHGSFDMVKPARPNVNARPDTYQPIDSRHPIDPLQPTSDYEQPTQPLGVVTNLDGTAADISSMRPNRDPLNRPMQSAINPAQVAKKKIKPGFIIGMICSIFIAIGCAVAAILFFANMNKDDAVSMAINKLLSTEAPENIKTEGSIDISYNDTASLIESMKIRVNSEMATKYLINSSQFSLNAQLRNGKSFSVDLDEVYAANGDLYIKIGGLTDALSNINQATNPESTPADTTQSDSTPQPEAETTTETPEARQSETEECLGEDCPVPEDQSETLLALGAVLDAFDTVDGEWLRIPLDSLDLKSSDDTETNSALTCAVNMINDIHSTEFTDYYQKNPFITSTTEEMHASNKYNPIYKVLISSKNFTNFVNEARKSQFVNDLAACWGYEKTNFSADQLLSSLQTLPEMYVEVDGAHNLTRFYYVTELKEENATMTVDLDFTYPTNVNVPEPTEYKNIDEVVQNLSQSLDMTTEPEQP